MGKDTKISKWNYVKLKSFCTAKATINKVKKQPLKWEKTVAHNATDRGLKSRIYKDLQKYRDRKKKKPCEEII